MTDLDPRRRKRGFYSLVIAGLLFALLGMMKAIEPLLFPDRNWDWWLAISAGGPLIASAFCVWQALTLRQQKK
jgi:hypothetical protein